MEVGGGRQVGVMWRLEEGVKCYKLIYSCAVYS